MMILEIVIIVFLLIVILVLGYYLLRVQQRNIRLEKEFFLVDTKIKHLQLESLESRLDPHLFKNILNSIQSHAYQTYFALDKMAGVLDYVLYDSQKKLVSPREEHQFALSLIEINKIKISPLFQLNVKNKIAANEILYDQNVLAPLISIDLIENAFKHADLQSADSFISILFEIKDGSFHLMVSNKTSPKHALKKQHSGFGLESLHKRLEIIYKEHFRLERFVENDVYIAHLKINLNDFKAKMHSTG
ncbi:sensor histidine kinase [Flavobacterium sp. NKUCC04_CG]|uniref:sensor histidine kinase n=1 Tax=Flavobacterium sp. NKUCC04_CG TaxID=2842121 RepID=UPI00351D1806